LIYKYSNSWPRGLGKPIRALINKSSAYFNYLPTTGLTIALLSQSHGMIIRVSMYALVDTTSSSVRLDSTPMSRPVAPITLLTWQASPQMQVAQYQGHPTNTFELAFSKTKEASEP